MPRLAPSIGGSFFAGRNREEQALGTADKRIASFVEAQWKIGRARNANAHGLTDGAGGATGDTKPEIAGSAQIDTIMAAIDAKRGGQTAGAAS